jgi:uncharacterized membrane protein YraQ (UPF0718 family)
VENKNNKVYLYLLFIPLLIAIYFNLEWMVNGLIYSLFKLDPLSHFTLAIHFFIYEVPKVLILLSLIVFAVGIVRSYFSPEKTRKKLEGKPLLIGNVLASMLGIVTPFCSCSAVPLFIGFVEAGIPLGVTFSFLIAAPMINEIAVILLFGLFGWKIAFIYIFTGLLIAVVAGYIIGKLKLEKFVEGWVYEIKSGNINRQDEKFKFTDRIEYGMVAVKDIVSKVWIYVIAGIAVGAGVHGYVPENFMASIMGKEVWWSVPVSVLIGIPLYSNAAGIIPIIQALLEKGASLGTALAFMMSVIGLSLPEAIILKKVLKLPMLFIFFGIVGVGITLVGYIFNFIY